jgi:serine phosphatase RsbU (regulator of sigma subunit)
VLDLPVRISEWLLMMVRSQRAVAHLLIDGDLELITAGGELEYYGLSGLRPRFPAVDQLPFLEGLLPLPETSFLLQSMEMPSGRVADIHFFAGDEDATWIVLLDVSVEHGDARKIQQKAYDMTLLSQREARLIAKLEGAHRELTQTHRELTESREALLRAHTRLQHELRDAERYVQAILPPPITEPFKVDWLFAPSTELGGDSFGYQWIDSEHFALYLLDVCGHGVGPALLSVAVANALRSTALPNTDFLSPESVVGSLNQSFQMEQHDNLYFTIWYGVYHHPTRRLRYTSAGHPPPILVSGTGESRGEAIPLRAKGTPVGLIQGAEYSSEECTLDVPARLFLFSDGVFEVTAPDGSMLEFKAFEEFLTRPVSESASELEGILRFAKKVHGADTLEDDFSIIRMTI